MNLLHGNNTQKKENIQRVTVKFEVARVFSSVIYLQKVMSLRFKELLNEYRPRAVTSTENRDKRFLRTVGIIVSYIGISISSLYQFFQGKMIALLNRQMVSNHEMATTRVSQTELNSVVKALDSDVKSLNDRISDVDFSYFIL